MIISEPNQLIPPGIPDTKIPDSSGPEASTYEWLTGKARHSLACAAHTLKHLPNPAYYASSAPARLITLLTLAGKCIADVTTHTSVNAKPTSLSTLTNSTDSFLPVPLTPPDVKSPGKPAWMAALNSQNEHDSGQTEEKPPQVVIEREATKDEIEAPLRYKRSPRGSSSSRGGGSRGSGSSRRGSRRSSGGVGGGGSHHPLPGPKGGKSTGRQWLGRIGGKKHIGREYAKMEKNYFTGRKWFKPKGISKHEPVNLHDTLLFSKTGKLKDKIITPQGNAYKIEKSNHWLMVKNDKQIISTIPKAVKFNHGANAFKLGVFNIYSPWLPVTAYFLYHDKTAMPFELYFRPSTSDNSKTDIGYYAPSTNESPTGSVNHFSPNGTFVYQNSTAVIDDSDKHFIKIASVPKGSAVSFALLNNQKPKTETGVPTSATETPTSLPDITTPAHPTNGSQSLSTNTNCTDVSEPTPMPIKPLNSTDIESNNNMTRVNTLLNEESLLTDVSSQLVIMNEGEVLKIIGLPHRVSQFFLDSENDTVFTYSMDEPTSEEVKYVDWQPGYWYSSANKVADQSPYNLLLPMLGMVGINQNILG
ncbi:MULTISPECIES: hypothetical protein [unclassified Endozoicomonas]|uniref:hypothetical protein n=1 Tax=unclassified Endozoicomonas TaxID=2644528 RepID=UPI003BB50045